MQTYKTSVEKNLLSYQVLNMIQIILKGCTETSVHYVKKF